MAVFTRNIIQLVNFSTLMSDADLTLASRALQISVTNFCKDWNIPSVNLAVYVKSNANN